MTPTEHLHWLHFDYYREQYPNVPSVSLPKPKYKANTTNGMTRMIIDYIRYSGGFAERINRMGFKTKTKTGREIWVSGGGTNGTSDISAILPGGRSARIEVKSGRDHIRPDQVRYAERVTRAGALYFVARSFDSFYEWYHTVVVILLLMLAGCASVHDYKDSDPFRGSDTVYQAKMGGLWEETDTGYVKVLK